MENEFLDLPDVPRFSLANSPLVLALCQIQFSPLLSINSNNPNFVAPFQEAIKSIYPVSNVMAPKQDEFLDEAEQSEFAYQFADKKDMWRLILSQNYIALETRKYDKFEEFLNRLEFALDALSTHIKPTLITRIGLRYIDEIRNNNNSSWEEMIKPSFLGPIGLPSFTKYAEKSNAFHHVLLTFSNGRGISMRYGLLSEGTLVRRIKGDKTDITKPFYLLDYDVFQQIPSSEDYLEVDGNLISKKVAKFHKVIDQLFLASVTEKFLDERGIKRYE